jgi:flagellin
LRGGGIFAGCWGGTIRPKNLLDVSLENATFQVGANQTISFVIKSAETSKLSVVTTASTTGSNVDGTKLEDGDISMNDTRVGASTTASAKDIATAISSVDAALQQINEMRGAMGAVQGRFESIINNLQSASENISAARIRIVDADFASETAELTKAQILQQAGTAMLAQANQLPQAVLALLG